MSHAVAAPSPTATASDATVHCFGSYDAHKMKDAEEDQSFAASATNNKQLLQQQQGRAQASQAQDTDALRKHEEIKRSTPRYKFNITTKSEKKRYTKLALTEAVFVFPVDVAAEYRRLRQEAAQLMHTTGPFSAEAMEAHSRFEAFHQENLIRHLPSVGLKYDEDSGTFVQLE